MKKKPIHNLKFEYMQLKNAQEALLKSLLQRFHKKIFISDDELRQAHIFLFAEKGLIPLLNDKELFETISYLKEIIELNRFKSIEDLVRFYDLEAENLKNYISDAIQETNDGEVSALSLKDPSFYNNLIRYNSNDDDGLFGFKWNEIIYYQETDVLIPFFVNKDSRSIPLFKSQQHSKEKICEVYSSLISKHKSKVCYEHRQYI